MLHHLKNHAASHSASRRRAHHRECQPPVGAEGHDRICSGDAYPADRAGCGRVPGLYAWRPRPAERRRQRPAYLCLASLRTAPFTIVAHRAEMGTGANTSIPMIIADEMEADWSRVKIVQAPGDEPKYGNQETDGSRSIRHHIQPAREMGASVRQHARGGRRHALGRRRRRRRREQPPGDAQDARNQPRLWRSRGRRHGASDSGSRRAPLQGREGVPLCRQGRGADLRPASTSPPARQSMPRM